jgi:riboflavin transporter FmnP
MNATTRALTLGGLLSALSLLFLVIGTVSPTADLSLYALSSLPVAIAVIELGQRRAWLVYLAVSLIGLACLDLLSRICLLLFWSFSHLESCI